MLREYEPERRRLRDDAEIDRIRWERYRQGKIALEELGLDPDEHMAMVQELAKRLGV